MPRTTSTQASKAYKSLARPYVELANLFVEGIERGASARKLISEANIGHQMWQDDFNSGLVGQVVLAYRRFSVQHLQKTYAALSIGEIARKTSPDPNNFPETGSYIQSLIASELLRAEIAKPSDDQQTWIVRFSGTTRSSAHNFSVPQYSERVKLLLKNASEADRHVLTSSDYSKEIRKVQKAKGNTLPLDAEGPFLPGGSYVEDEDMMADL